jgi:hypothetical protein
MASKQVGNAATNLNDTMDVLPAPQTPQHAFAAAGATLILSVWRSACIDDSTTAGIAATTDAAGPFVG